MTIVHTKQGDLWAKQPGKCLNSQQALKRVWCSTVKGTLVKWRSLLTAAHVLHFESWTRENVHSFIQDVRYQPPDRRPTPTSILSTRMHAVL